MHRAVEHATYIFLIRHRLEKYHLGIFVPESVKDGLTCRNKSIARWPAICQVGPACGQTIVQRVGRRRKRKEKVMKE